jgi:hypothetical protein
MNSMNIVCVGSSFPLKQRVARVFTDYTIPQAVEEIVTAYGFNYIGQNSREKFSQLTIAGLTYWEWIVEQAKRIGYGIMVDGMNFIFLPLDILLDAGIPSSAILSIGDATIPYNVQALDRTLDSFKVTSGDNIEDSVNYRTIKNVGGVDPVTNAQYFLQASPAIIGTNLREQTSDVLFSEYRTDRVISNTDSAHVEAYGAAELARFNLPAAVSGQGDPRIRPFSTVFISGTGNLTDGFWMVKEARHMFHKIGDYVIELKIATDGLGDSVATSLRNTTPNALGVRAVNDNLGYNTTYFSMEGVKLTSSAMIIKEGSQGYIKLPQEWKSIGA